jgi:pre-mRNA-splicing factor SYF2/beta-D-xylosidase 4
LRKVAAAAAMAATADAVVMAVGTDLRWAREGHDATSVAFSDGQLALIKAVAAAAKKPIIIVTMTATPLDLTELLSNPKVLGTPSLYASHLPQHSTRYCAHHSTLVTRTP